MAASETNGVSIFLRLYSDQMGYQDWEETSVYENLPKHIESIHLLPLLVCIGI